MRWRRSEDRELMRKMKTSESRRKTGERTKSRDVKDEIGKLGREGDTKMTN